MEKIILNSLLSEIYDKNILCNRQIGLIRRCGTELNLIRLPKCNNLNYGDSKLSQAQKFNISIKLLIYIY